MLTPHLIVRHSRVMERDLCPVSVWFHCHRHDGLGAFGSLRHPCVLDLARPIDLKETSVMWPNAAFMLNRYIEDTIHNRI